MRSEKRVPKFHPDDVHYPDLESASDWMNQIFNQSGPDPVALQNVSFSQANTVKHFHSCACLHIQISFEVSCGFFHFLEISFILVYPSLFGVNV